MSYFSKALKNLRVKQGCTSARHFHNRVLEQGEKSFNYPYYVRLEKGTSTPSTKTLNSLLKHFIKDQREELIKAWCKDQFPDYQHIFKAKKQMIDTSVAIGELVKVNPNELSNREVYTLYKSRVHYLVFLLATLSRINIKVSELNNYFDQELLSTAVQDLKKEKLIYINEGELCMHLVDRVFPPPSHEDIRKVYNQFDQWDLEVSETFNFEPIIKRKFVRRVSYRYIKLIQNHINLLLDFIKSSDEVNDDHNDHVISFQVDFKTGQLPG